MPATSCAYNTAGQGGNWQLGNICVPRVVSLVSAEVQISQVAQDKAALVPLSRAVSR